MTHKLDEAMALGMKLRGLRDDAVASEKRLAALVKPYVIQGWERGDWITMQAVDNPEDTFQGYYVVTSREDLAGIIRIRSEEGRGVNHLVTEWIFTNVTKEERE